MAAIARVRCWLPESEPMIEKTSLAMPSRTDAASARRHSAPATLPRIHEKVPNTTEFRWEILNLSFNPGLVSPPQQPANNRESNRKRTSKASCRRRRQHLLMPGAGESLRFGEAAEEHSRIWQNKTKLVRTSWQNETKIYRNLGSAGEPGTSPGAVPDLRYSVVTSLLRRRRDRWPTIWTNS